MKYYRFIYSTLILLLYTSLNFAQIANDLIPKNEPFFIQSAINWNKNSGGCWDIPGGEENIREKAPLKTWELSDRKKDRRYAIENSSAKGYVRIHIEGVAGYIDIKGGENKNGTDLQILNPNNSSAQNWQFMYLGNGKFKIFNQNGKIITLAGRSSKNGSQIQMWDDHPGEWTEWYLISANTNKTLTLEDKLTNRLGEDMSGIGKFYIQSALTYGTDAAGFFDAPGRGEPKQGSNLQTWELDFGPDRLFRIVNSSSSFSHYSICTNGSPDILIDIAGNNTANGTNVQLWGKNNGPAQNFYFKHLGGGRFKIYTSSNKVVCLPREAKNGSNIHIWDDHDGAWMEWYLIEESTNRPYIPMMEGGGMASIQDLPVVNVSCSNEQQLIDNIHAAYSKVLNVQGKIMQVNDGINKSTNTIGTAYNLTNNFSNLNNDVNDTYNAVSAFTNIPLIGTAVKVLSTSLNLAKTQLNGANTALSTMKEPVIGQANSNVEVSKKTIICFTASLSKLSSSLFAMKTKLFQAKNKAGSEALFAELNNKMTAINTSLQNAENYLNEINESCKSVDKLEKPVSKVNDGVKNFEKAFRQTDKVADEINDVLNKRFKKEIAKVKINISLRDVLEGGKVGKVFKKYASEWADDMLKPLLKKLNVKIPTVPGVDEFKNSLTESADLTRKLKTDSEEIQKLMQQINTSNNEITGALNKLS